VPTYKTIAPAVKLALKNALAARGGLTGVTVSYGSPLVPGAPPGEYVELAGIRHEQEAATASYSAGGPRHVEERFELDLWVSSTRKGDPDHQVATERAYALAAEVEDAIRADLTVGGSIVNGWAGVVALELAELGPSDQGVRESLIKVTVAVRARI